MKLLPTMVVNITSLLLFLWMTIQIDTIHATATTTTDIQTHFNGVDTLAYQEWVAAKGDQYVNFNFFEAPNDPTSGAAIHWRLDEENVYLAVAVRATGWMGFAIADAGGMPGSDMVIYQTSNNETLLDMHVLEALVPIMDQCQDWVYVDSFQEGGFLIFEGMRKIDSADPQDKKLLNDAKLFLPPQRVLFAWGDEPTHTYHTPSRRTRGVIRWQSTGDERQRFAEEMARVSDGYIEFSYQGYPIKNITTEYPRFCWNWDDVVAMHPELPANGQISVMGFEPVIDESAKEFVHHVNFFAGTESSANPRECLPFPGDYPYFVYSYVTNSIPYALPDGVGYNYGPASNKEIDTFQIQVHYDNPKELAGFTDSGGVRLYYSFEPRPIEVGVMPMADPFNDLRGVEVGDGLSHYDFQCKDSRCSGIALDEPVTVIREYMHMHANGVAGFQRQIRDGKVIHEAAINFFDFDQAGTVVLRDEPFQVQAGDTFQTECYFKAENGTIFGARAEDEMCQGFLVYYPAKKLISNKFPWVCVYDAPLEACNAELTVEQLGPETTPIQERSFGFEGEGACGALATLPAIPWIPDSGNDSATVRLTVYTVATLCLVAWTALM